MPRRSSRRSPGEPEWPLRVIVVGHNPSEKAWELGHYYGNPSNRMWKLLSSAGIVPPDFTASDDDVCPITSGVGFTDVVCNTRSIQVCSMHTECPFTVYVGAGGGRRRATGVGLYHRERVFYSTHVLWSRSTHLRACENSRRQFSSVRKKRSREVSSLRRLISYVPVSRHKYSRHP